LTLPYNRVSQRHEISNGGTSSEILEVRSGGAVLTTGGEELELVFGRIDLRVQFVEVSFVELSGNGFVDVSGHGVLPECLVLLDGVKTINRPRTEGGDE
jgi:hypothetical protein